MVVHVCKDNERIFSYSVDHFDISWEGKKVALFRNMKGKPPTFRHMELKFNQLTIAGNEMNIMV
ncbi:MAG: hypothetical protein J6Y93_03780 [Treponema sp.]|nr:hypothetical protein [Treponema sp.]